MYLAALHGAAGTDHLVERAVFGLRQPVLLDDERGSGRRRPAAWCKPRRRRRRAPGKARFAGSIAVATAVTAVAIKAVFKVFNVFIFSSPYCVCG